MKITKIGWVGKSQGLPRIFRDYDRSLNLEAIWSKGKRDDWIPEDWPPRKVRVTVEDFE